MPSIVKKTLTIFFTAAIASIFLYLLYISRVVLLYLVIAAFLALAINPLVRQLEKMKMSRTLSAVAAMLIIVIVLIAVSATIATPLALQGTAFVQNLPAITNQITHNSTVEYLTGHYDISKEIQDLSGNASILLLGSGASFIYVIGNIVSFTTKMAIILVLAFLLLIEGGDIWQGAIKKLKPDQKARAEKTAKKIAHAISGFVSGNLFISLIAGVVTLIVLLIFHVPYVFALAALVAMFDLIPLIGAAIGTIVVGLVALTQGWLIAIIVVVILLIYQFVEGHLIQPVVYSRSITLSPLLIIIASVLGADLGGIVGILLAIPVAAIVQILITEIATGERLY